MHLILQMELHHPPSPDAVPNAVIAQWQDRYLVPFPTSLYRFHAFAEEKNFVPEGRSTRFSP